MSSAPNEFLARVGIALPIIQAPMAGVSTPAMAAAVSNAGGLGSIGVGAADAAEARRMMREIRQITDRPFNVNVFCHRPARANAQVNQAWIARLRPQFEQFGRSPPAALSEIYTSFVEDDAMLAMFLEEKLPIVSFHFGVPDATRIRALRDAGIFLIGSATSLSEARELRTRVDAIVAQGFEAGGHRGVFDPDAHDDCLSTLALTRILAREIDLPIIAAGGIMDGAGIEAALNLGASAAQLGTAFIACDESSADAGYREALFSEAAHHTQMTRVISGRPARCLRNAFTTLGDSFAYADIPDYPMAYDLGKSLHLAAKSRGEFGFGAQWAGQGAPLSRRATAADLTAALADEWRAAHFANR